MRGYKNAMIVSIILVGVIIGFTINKTYSETEEPLFTNIEVEPILLGNAMSTTIPIPKTLGVKADGQMMAPALAAGPGKELSLTGAVCALACYGMNISVDKMGKKTLKVAIKTKNCGSGSRWWTTVIWILKSGDTTWKPENQIITRCGYENAGDKFYILAGFDEDNYKIIRQLGDNDYVAVMPYGYCQNNISCGECGPNLTRVGVPWIATYVYTLKEYGEKGNYYGQCQ